VRSGLAARRRLGVDLLCRRPQRSVAHARVRLQRARVERARALRHALGPLPALQPAPPGGSGAHGDAVRAARPDHDLSPGQLPQLVRPTRNAAPAYINAATSPRATVTRSTACGAPPS